MSAVDPVAIAHAATTAAAGSGRPVLEHALELATAARTIAELLDRLESCVRFTATVEAVELEQTSTRLLVSVRSRPGEDLEQLRTDRTDGAAGAMVADRARRLVGTRVVVHKALEDAGTDRKVRVVAWLDPIDTAAPAMPPASPAPRPAPAVPATGAPADRLRSFLDAAGVPVDHADALMATRYGVATVEDLAPESAEQLLDRLVDPQQLERFRSAAASDRRAEADVRTGRSPS